MLVRATLIKQKHIFLINSNWLKNETDYETVSRRVFLTRDGVTDNISHHAHVFHECLTLGVDSHIWDKGRDF